MRKSTSVHERSFDGVIDRTALRFGSPQQPIAERTLLRLARVLARVSSPPEARARLHVTGAPIVPSCHRTRGPHALALAYARAPARALTLANLPSAQKRAKRRFPQRPLVRQHNGRVSRLICRSLEQLAMMSIVVTPPQGAAQGADEKRVTPAATSPAAARRQARVRPLHLFPSILTDGEGSLAPPEPQPPHPSGSRTPRPSEDECRSKRAAKDDADWGTVMDIALVTAVALKAQRTRRKERDSLDAKRSSTDSLRIEVEDAPVPKAESSD